MKSIISVLAVCVLALGVIGCSSSSTAPSDSVSVQQLFPLKVGNQWIYQTLDLSSGTIPDTSYYTLTVAGTTPVTGVNTFRLVATNDQTPGADTTYLFYGSNGIDLMTLNDVSNGIARAQILLRAPMIVGDSVVMQDSTYADGYRVREVLYFRSKNTTITTPAGTFGCYYYDDVYYNQQSPTEPLSLESETELYLAPGVGFVHEQLYSMNNGVKETDGNLSLKSYTLK